MALDPACPTGWSGDVKTISQSDGDYYGTFDSEEEGCQLVRIHTLGQMAYNFSYGPTTQCRCPQMLYVEDSMNFRAAGCSCRLQQNGSGKFECKDAGGTRKYVCCSKD